MQDGPFRCARGSLATDQFFLFCVLVLVFALIHMQSAPFHVRYNGGPAYHKEGKTWTIRSVDHSAKASSGATWSLM